MRRSRKETCSVSVEPHGIERSIHNSGFEGDKEIKRDVFADIWKVCHSQLSLQDIEGFPPQAPAIKVAQTAPSTVRFPFPARRKVAVQHEQIDLDPLQRSERRRY
jgi:hypothetical protein